MKKIVFLNQTMGPTSIDIVNLLDRSGFSIDLYAGTIQTTTHDINPSINYIRSPRYRRTNVVLRAVTWATFWLRTLFSLTFKKPKFEVFAVTNPPFNLFTCLFLKKTRGIEYHLLIFDVYPDALVQYDYASSQNYLIRFWGWLNSKAISNAKNVFTISEKLKESLRKYCSTNTSIYVVHSWADTEAIKPRQKQDNVFLSHHQLTDKHIVLYSGNFGKTHDIATIVNAASFLKNHGEIHFVLIGGGEQFPSIKRMIRSKNLDNITLLPFQPKGIFPHSISSGDLSLVTLGSKAEYLSVPSKTYYLMAAGSPIIALTSKQSEVADLVRKHKMGVIVPPGESRLLADAILKILKCEETRSRYSRNARAASNCYTSRNAEFFRDMLMN